MVDRDNFVRGDQDVLNVLCLASIDELLLQTDILSLLASLLSP